MFVAGDEFMRTQGGNNNPYNQDNETSWIDWRLLEKNADIFRFFQHMIALRKSHPSLCRSRFWRDDVCWHPSGRCVAFFLSGRGQGDANLYVMINPSGEDVELAVPAEHAGLWRRVIDTSLPSPDDIVEQGNEVLLDTSSYLVKSRSVVVLMM